MSVAFNVLRMILVFQQRITSKTVHKIGVPKLDSVTHLEKKFTNSTNSDWKVLYFDTFQTVLFWLVVRCFQSIVTSFPQWQHYHRQNEIYHRAGPIFEKKFSEIFSKK